MHTHHLLSVLPIIPLAVASGGHFVTTNSPSPLSKRETCSKILAPSYQSPVIGSGWVAQIIANSLSSPRSIVFDPSGGLLVLEQNKGITRLTFSSEGGDDSTCLVEESREPVVEDSGLLHGLALSKDGRTLYASTSDKVYAWPYNSESGTVTGELKTLVQGMDSGGHVTRTILLLEGESEGMMLVSRGSDGNLDPQTRNIDSGVSQLRSFNLTAMASEESVSTLSYTDGAVVAWGLRNSVGLAQDPVTGGIWSVENSVDQVKRLGQDVHTDNPGEELNFHGSHLDGSGPEGSNFGYPDCFAVWGTQDFPDLGNMTVGSQFANEGSGKTDQQCREEAQGPRLTFQAHTAPLDVLVPTQGVAGRTTDGGEREMYVTFHGSWNRDNPVGYSLVSIPLDPTTGQPLAESTATDASSLVMGNPDMSECPGGCFRPVGLAVDEGSNRLFMTSDSTGEIFVFRKADFSTGNLPTGGGDGGELVGGSGNVHGMGGYAIPVGCSLLTAIVVAGMMGL